MASAYGIAWFYGARFAGEPDNAIRRLLEADGWEPLLISDEPGTVYPEHEHAAAKLLVILKGSMTVESAGEVFRCQRGDLLVIPGYRRHAALVGETGCTFFWSEQVRRLA